jgi:CRP/FNR family transcriptional regulator, dissimilatory nitrate respiration regulator
MNIPGNVVLFEGIEPSEAIRLLSCVSYTGRTLRKGDKAIKAGEEVSCVGIVISGTVQIVREGFDGKRVIQASFGRGAVFAETLAFAKVKKSPITVVASETSEVLMIPWTRLLRTCDKACEAHHRVIENMMRIIAEKNLFLNRKLEILSGRTMREKVMTFLSHARADQGSSSFTIPYTRAELADFLCVDRSALSRELGNMRDEGILSFSGQTFTLVKKPFVDK